MATFRKSASKTRAALENSTALPPATSDVLDHAGEQAVRMTNPAKSKSSRKAGPAPAATTPLGLDTVIASITAAPAVEPASATSLEAARATADITSPTDEQPVVAAEAQASTIELVSDLGADIATTTGSAARAIEATTAELESVMADIADQVSHTSADVLRTATELATQTLDQPGSQAQDITSAATAIEVASAETAAAAADGASRASSEAGSAPALVEFNARLANLFRDYVDDSLAFLAAMTAVRSVPEAISLNQQHFQRRLDALASQSRDLTLLAGKVAAQTLIPFTPAAFR